MKFFIGIRLPTELEATCEQYRRAFKAPKTVSHITVVPPFSWGRSVQDLIEVLETNLEHVQPFEVFGSGIGSFDTRVLFVNVKLTPELNALQQTLVKELRRQDISVDGRTYHPHITLATRLSPQQFSRYTRKLGDFNPEYAFTCSNLCLFHFSDGAWTCIYSVNLILSY